jgi:hypothetical protein
MESNAPTKTPTQAPTTLKVIEVEPAAAGPDVKPVRQKKPLTEAQKAALQRGRERLAERRKQMKEGNEGSAAAQPEVAVAAPNAEKESDTSSTSSLDSDQEAEADDYDEAQSTAYCSMM